MPAIQSIGLASDGALDQKTIDKLKEADTNAQITPIEKRITETKKQNTELSSLLVSIAGMKGAQNPLTEDTEYVKVSTDTIGKSVSVVVSAGVSPQNINIRVKQLAKEDIIQSDTFKTKEDVLSTKDAILGISLNGRNYEVKIKGSQNLEEDETATKLIDLPSLIAEATSKKVIGSTINTGGDTPITLILKSREVGKQNAILLGTVFKASKSIDSQVLNRTIFKGDDFSINGVQILDKLTKTTHLGDAVDEENDLPFQFNPEDLKINGIDIFDGTKKTNTTSNAIISVDAEAQNDDFLLNGINIFDTSGFAEAPSSIKIDSLEFPFDISLNTLTLNGVNIFDSSQATTITTAILKDEGVTGIYKNNHLMINGISIFDLGVDTEIDSVLSLVEAINLKSDNTNVTASFNQLTDGNIKMTLTNDVNGDNIDINTSEPLQLAKMRLSKGVTLGQSNISVKNKQELLDIINQKTQSSAVQAIEVDGNLVLRSTRTNGRVLVNATNPSFIEKVGLKEEIYNNPIPVKVASIEDLISNINKKTNLHDIIASNKDGKLYLERTTLGKNIEITGKQSFLTKINLQATIIKPDKGKLITSIDDVITSINLTKDSSFVEASIKDKKIYLKSTKEASDITISGKSDSLKVIGLAEILVSAINGEKLESSNAVVERINEKSSTTNIKAFLGNDDRITLLNTIGGNIEFSGDEAQINILNFSIDDNIKVENAISNKELLEKLGINKPANKLQSAQDSIFTYNGVDITRDSNTIEGSVTEIAPGIEFQLKQVDAENESTSISIAKDKKTIINSFFEFITAYNSFIRKISDLTKFTFDENAIDDAEIGVFQGKTTITKIPFQLSTILGTILPDIPINSLISLGIDFTRDGTISYEEDEIRNKINANFDDVKKLFFGYTKKTLTGVEQKIDGIFTKLNSKINDLTVGNKSVLETFKSSIEQETGRLSKTLKRTQETIDNRYEQLKKSFISNDAEIGKLNSNFQSLKTQMEYETAKQ